MARIKRQPTEARTFCRKSCAQMVARLLGRAFDVGQVRWDRQDVTFFQLVKGHIRARKALLRSFAGNLAIACILHHDGTISTNCSERVQLACAVAVNANTVATLGVIN